MGVLARYSSDPTVAHLAALKRVLRYLRGTTALGLRYGSSSPSGVASSTLVGYTDADYGGDKESRKSTTGCVILYAGAPTTWCSRRQQITATSTMEAEYTALATGVSEAVWLRSFLGELGLLDVIANGAPIILRVDNTAAIAVATSIQHPPKAKHIDIRLHVIQDRVVDRSVTVTYVATNDMIADGLTKGLPRPAFMKLREGMGMVSA